jgi:hypothetical protein
MKQLTDTQCHRLVDLMTELSCAAPARQKIDNWSCRIPWHIIYKIRFLLCEAEVVAIRRENEAIATAEGHMRNVYREAYPKADMRDAYRNYPFKEVVR